MESLVPLLAEYGALGLVIVILLVERRQKDQRIEDLTNKLIEHKSADATKFNSITLTLERVLMLLQPRHTGGE